MATLQILELNDESFDDEVFDTEHPVLVEFWADSCYACRSLEAVFERLANEFAGKAKVARIDAESNWQTASRFDITNLPTTLLFQNNQVVERIVGERPEHAYRSALNDAVAGNWEI